MDLAVIMSLYKNDRLKNLKLAVESILSQTYTSFDFYIQFDGPVDSECSNYLKSLQDERIFIFERNENLGLAKSLNELLTRVLAKQYKYIARMDADDICLGDRLEKQVNFLNENLEVDCLGGWAIEIDEEGKEYFKKQMPGTHDECNEMFKLRDCMIHPTVMFRKSYFEKAGLYPEDTYFGEDTMMWAQGFSNNCKFANLPENLLYFRLDKNFFERRRGWKHAKSIFTLRRKVNKMLGYGLKADIYAYMYAIAKLMPTSILNLIYKTVR
jgi:glycosyltransferase involved in cell wall biosynthesis